MSVPPCHLNADYIELERACTTFIGLCTIGDISATDGRSEAQRVAWIFRQFFEPRERARALAIIHALLTLPDRRPGYGRTAPRHRQG